MAIEFPQWVKERVIGRQGKLFSTETLDPARTAFVVVDLQNFYMMPGFMLETPPARAIIPKVNQLAASMRAAGGTVIWVQTSADGADKFWSKFHAEMLRPEYAARRLRELASDSPGFELHADLDVQPQDLKVVKRCYSALSEGSSDLAAQLRQRGIDTVLIGGTVTNVCCESTARDAMLMDFRTIMVDDALAAVTEQEHLFSLYNWMLFFGDVLDVAQVEKALAPQTAAAA